MEKELKKPEKRVEIPSYNYMKCRDYVEKKYGFKERGFMGFNTSLSYFRKDVDLEDTKCGYRDFWHWIIDIYHVFNGCHFTMDECEIFDILEFKPDDWRYQITEKFMDEFGEGEVGSRTIPFFVFW